MGVARTNEQDATQVAIFGSIRHHFSRPLALFVLFVSAYLVQGLVKVSNQAAHLSCDSVRRRNQRFGMLGISPSTGPLSGPLAGSGMSYREETIMVPQHPVVRLVMLGASSRMPYKYKHGMPAELAIRR